MKVSMHTTSGMDVARRDTWRRQHQLRMMMMMMMMGTEIRQRKKTKVAVSTHQSRFD